MGTSYLKRNWLLHVFILSCRTTWGLRSTLKTPIYLFRVQRNEPRLSLQNHQNIPSRTHLQRLSRDPGVQGYTLGSNASDNCLNINSALWWLYMMPLESHEICYWYPPLAEDIGAQTKEFGLAVRPSRVGTKRSRTMTMGRMHIFLLNRQQCARIDLTPHVVRQTGPLMLEHSQTTSAEDYRYLNRGSGRNLTVTVIYSSSLLLSGVS